jgi:D-arabinose 1-dehydrogenase-like Zn-dependent alcohol dehydrogenase
MDQQTQFECYAVEKKGQPLKPWKYTPRPLGPEDIEIDIICCGICGSDVHQMTAGWTEVGVPTIYPIVPGHEIIGTVTALGKDVKHLQIGQRVGVGAQCKSCMNCPECHRGEESYCLNGTNTYNARYPDGSVSYGGYAKKVRVDSRFAFPIPSNLPSEAAAPLLCAGITVFSPLNHYQLGPGHNVAVLGIGGLGHLGLKFARALGCTVTAISSNPQKEKDAMKCGAHHFLLLSDHGAMAKARRTFDFILSTVSGDIDYSLILSTLKVDGRFVMVGIPEKKIQIPAPVLIGNRVSIGGSAIGSRKQIAEMLELCSKHNITADVEIWPLEKCNEAVAGFMKGLPRYRYVLKVK